MKIGDKVRFLSEVGGGRVCGFRDKNIVLVEDEDGFQIPMLISQVVLIDEEKDRKADKAEAAKTAPPERHETQPLPKRPAALPKTPATNGTINLYLSFLPEDVKAISSTRFETYLVNDSDYFLEVLYLSAEGSNWRARFKGLIEPDTKVFVEDFDRSQLNDLERLCIQTLAWKPDRMFALKPALTTEIRLDLTKFYKLHVFQPDPFFRDACLTVPVIRNDRPVRSLFSDQSAMKDALLRKQ